MKMMIMKMKMKMSNEYLAWPTPTHMLGVVVVVDDDDSWFPPSQELIQSHGRCIHTLQRWESVGVLLSHSSSFT